MTTADPYHAQYVNCEKPLAPEASVCKEIVDMKMAGGKKLVQVGFMRRYDYGYRQLKNISRKKTYGEPHMLHCAHRNPTVPESYDTPMAVKNSMIHEIDILRWLLGEDYVAAEVVFPKKTRQAHKNLQDPQIMRLWTKSSVLIDVEAFVCAGYGYDIKCEVCCEIRRVTMFKTGIVGTMLSLLTIALAAISMEGSPSLPYIVLSMTIVFLWFMQSCIGPCLWLIIAEIFPLQLRALGMGIAIFMLRIFDALVGAAFFVFVLTLMIAFVFVHRHNVGID